MDFEMLEKYARVNYTQNLVKLDDYFTQVIFLNKWANGAREGEQQAIRNRKLNQPGYDKPGTQGDVKIDRALLDRYTKSRQT